MPDINALINAIDQCSESAIGSDTDSELSHERSMAIKAYLGRNIEPDEDGLSQVVDRSVFETVSWMLPSFTRIFAGDSDVVEFVPMEEDDEEAAKQEAQCLNYLVRQKTNWFEVVSTFVHDALLTKNAYMLVSMEEKLQIESEIYKRQGQEGVAQIMQEEGAEIIGQESYPDPSGAMEPVIGEDGQPVIDEALLQMDPETGAPIPESMIMMQPRMLYDIRVKRRKPQKQLKFRVLPPERCLVSQRLESFRLDDCDYFEYYENVTISDLRALGFDVPDDISDGSYDDNTEEEDARDQFTDIDSDDDMPDDPTMRRVRARTIWIRHDYDGDGLAELQRVIRVGNEILYREEETRIPVACIVPALMPHKHMGISVADMVFDIGRIRTAILRQGLNSLYLSNNQRHIISDKVVEEGLLSNVPGGIIQLDQGALPSEGHIQPLETPFVFTQAMQGLEMMDQIRESRTGMNRLFKGVDENVISETASGIAQLSSMAAQRIEYMARIFASGIEYAFSVAHELIMRHGMQTEKVKLSNQWVDIDPSTWRHGRDLKIVAPVGAGNKDAMVAKVMQILRVQKEAQAAGSRTVQEDNIYAAELELAKQMDYASPDKFFTDPSTLPPPEQKPSDVEIAAETERMKIESDERKKEAELDQRRDESDVNAQVSMYRANLEAEIKLVLEDAKRTGNYDMERIRNVVKLQPIPVGEDNLSAGEAFQRTQSSVNQMEDVLADALTQLSVSMNNMAAAQSAPKEVIRDNQGKTVGVRTIQ